jgi:hypothetical protein
VEGVGGLLRIAVILVAAAVVAFAGLGNRGPVPVESAAPTPVGVVEGVAAVPSADPSESAPASAPPTPSPAATPTTAPTPVPTAAPTAVPTAEPTVEPDPDPTPRPTPRRTPRPTHDPTPEGTPRITTASGSFGETLTVQGIKVRVAKTDPRTGAITCTTDDPDRQGWTEVVSYELRMTWPDADDAEEPWVAVGAKPWNVLQFDGPSPFRSGAEYVVTTCHRPKDSDKVMVEISPPGSPAIHFRWYFD